LWGYDFIEPLRRLAEKKKILDAFKKPGETSLHNLSIPKGTKAIIVSANYKENMPNSLKGVWDAEHSYAKGNIHRMVRVSPEGYKINIGFYGNPGDYIAKI
jgi:hypothetical protein